MTINEVLNNRDIITEKNVYGFLYILLLFCCINEIKPIDVINKMGDKYQNYILCGWGDLNQWKDIILTEWDDDILKSDLVYNVSEIECEKAREKVHNIWDEIYNIKITSTKKYAEIIKEYFEKTE